MRGFRAQLTAATAVTTATVMLVLAVATQILLGRIAHHDVDRALAERAAAARTVLAGPSGATATLDPGIRAYDASGRAILGSVEAQQQDRADELAARVLAGGTSTDVDGIGDYRLRGEPYTDATGSRGAVVVSQSTGPYERSERYALIVSVVLGLMAVGLAGGAAWQVSRRALDPVRRMAERADDWSEHDLAHRFALGPPTNELSRLGQTLDHLLDRVASAIRDERRLTAELAHELRTPLTAIRGSADVALLRRPDDPGLREDLAAIGDAARRMGEVVTGLLDLAREPGGPQGSAALSDVLPAVAALVPERLTLTTDLAAGLPAIAAPPELVVRALAPLVENATRYAASRVAILARPLDGRVAITVCDDGPGVAADVRDRLFEAGVSGRGGTGLGLGIARRVARSLGGDVALADDSAFVLTLPAQAARSGRPD